MKIRTRPARSPTTAAGWLLDRLKAGPIGIGEDGGVPGFHAKEIVKAAAAGLVVIVPGPSARVVAVERVE